MMMMITFLRYPFSSFFASSVSFKDRGTSWAAHALSGWTCLIESLAWTHSLAHTWSHTWSHSWSHSWAHARAHTCAHRLLHAHTWTAASRHSLISIDKAILLATCTTSLCKAILLVVVPACCNRLAIIVLVESNHSIAPICHYIVSLLVLGCRVVVDDSANAISGFIVILRVDLLHVLNILNELLVAALTRLESKVRKVGLDSLSISFDEAVNLREGEESVQRQASHVEQ